MIPFGDFRTLMANYKDAITCKIYNCNRIKRLDITKRTCELENNEILILYMLNSLYIGNIYLDQDELIILPCWMTANSFMRLISKVKDNI